jgi:EmrB/QacA subfamily drug resistance transporter
METLAGTGSSSVAVITESRRQSLGMALLAATQFLLVLDAAIVGVAMPQMAGDLNFAAAQLSWVPNAYTLLFGGFLLLGGRLSDHLGARRMFVLGVLLFTSASLVGSLTSSGAWLVGARAGQGLAAALVSPAALALVLGLFPEGPARNRSLGIWAGVGASGGAAGFILGGVLVTALDWRSIFYVNVPIGLLVAALAPRLLPPAPRSSETASFDVLGAFAVTVGIGSMIYALVEAGAAGWLQPTPLVAGVAAVAFLVGFAAIERRTTNPLLPPRLMARRGFTAAMAVAGTSTMAVFPMFFFVSLYTQEVLGYTPLVAGLAQLPISLLITGAALNAGRFIGRLGTARTLVFGLAVLAVGLVWLSRWTPEGDYLSTIFAPALLVAPAAGLTWVASTVAATSGAAPSDAGIYSGTLNTAQQLGGAVGLAALTGLATAGLPSDAFSGTVAPAVLSDGLAVGLLGAAAIAAVGALAAQFLLPRGGSDNQIARGPLGE